MKCIFTIDVEDWFHILDIPTAPPRDRWERLPSRVEANFGRLVDLLEEFDVRATCFFLGWIARQSPCLVALAREVGHEIASHGFDHRLIYKMDRGEFVDDVVKTKKILEDISGTEISGYRAPGFSLTGKTPWAFEALAEAGYTYDSSIFPAPRGHGGMMIDNLAPHVVSTNGSPLWEIPVSVARLAGRPVCFFGGGYLRLFPYSVIKRMTRRVLNEGRPVVFYIHPREIDPDHPRIPMSFSRRFKSYVNLNSTYGKLRRLLTDFEWQTCGEYIREASR
jgi:polysaccharide deacetylase family protein (PEP-CTERM system associated)